MKLFWNCVVRNFDFESENDYHLYTKVRNLGKLLLFYVVLEIIHFF